MALSTYAELQASVADWLNRDDLSARIPDFIRMAEAQMQRKLRIWQMQKRVTLTLTGRFTDLPSDWIGTMKVEGDRALELMGASIMAKRRKAYDGGGNACFYCHTAGQIEVYPSSESDVDFWYYAKIPTLADNDTNWLLDEAPDAYLFGALMQSAPFLVEDARIQTWGGLYASAINDLEAASKGAEFSGRKMVMRNG